MGKKNLSRDSNLIIGLRSFLGKNIEVFLRDRKEIVFDISYRPNKKKSFQDNLERLIQDHKIDSIFICGSKIDYSDSYETIDEIISSNILLPNYVCKAVKKYSPETEIFHFGSYWQFDKRLKLNPSNFYAASKTAAEETMKVFANDGLKISTIRLYDIYGRGDKRGKIFNLIKSIKKTKKIIQLTHPDQVINPLQVKDAVEGIFLARKQVRKKKSNGELYEFSLNPQNYVTLKELVSIFEEVDDFPYSNFIHYGKKTSYERPRMKINLPKPRYWSPSFTLNDGIADLLNS